MMKCTILCLGMIFLFGRGQLYSQTDKPCPCCSEKYRQFDFWIGDWITTTTNGDTAGFNRVVVLEDQCILQENWSSATSPYTGSSYNYYDPQDDQWHQTWVDNQGQSLRLSGNRIDNNMVLKSKAMKDQQGNPVFHRITWTANADGTVRQHWESSQDGESNWITAFDGLYHPGKR